jgi:ubiquitin
VSNTRTRTPKTVGEARAAALAHPLVAAIVAAEDRPFKDIEVSEWPMPDGSPMELRIRGASAAVVDAHDASMYAIRGRGNEGGEIDLSIELNKSFRARFLVGCMFDLDDEPIPITAEQLAAKSGRVVNRLFGIAQKLSGSNDRAVEDAGKDSETGQSESSTTG